MNFVWKPIKDGDDILAEPLNVLADGISELNNGKADMTYVDEAVEPKLELSDELSEGYTVQDALFEAKETSYIVGDVAELLTDSTTIVNAINALHDNKASVIYDNIAIDNVAEISDGIPRTSLRELIIDGHSIAEPVKNLIKIEDDYYGNGSASDGNGIVENGVIRFNDYTPATSTQIVIPFAVAAQSLGQPAVLSFSNTATGNFVVFLTSSDADGCRTDHIDMSLQNAVAYYSADSAVYSMADPDVEVATFGQVVWESLVIEIPSGSNIVGVQLYPQFEIGTEAHGFSPYGTNDIRPDRPATIKHVSNPSVELNGVKEIEFEGITLRSVGNSTDYIDLERGVVVRNVGEALMFDSTVKAEQGLSGTTTISSYAALSSNGNYFSLRMYPSSTLQTKLKIFDDANILGSPILSDKFIYLRRDRGKTAYAYSMSRDSGANPIIEVTLDIPNTATTAEATERFRKMQPFTLVYEAVETIEDLSAETLKELRLKHGMNRIILANDDNIPTIGTIEYAIDTKSYIDKKLGELQNAISVVEKTILNNV